MLSSPTTNVAPGFGTVGSQLIRHPCEAIAFGSATGCWARKDSKSSALRSASVALTATRRGHSKSGTETTLRVAG
jgi:hypothetical protein